MLKTLLGLSQGELETIVSGIGEPGYRSRQIAQWLYQQNAHSIDDMLSLPRKLRDSLSAEYEVGRSQIVAQVRSKDDTIKLLLKLRDNETIETVGIPYADRFSCCVSSQVGCPIGCAFCATGQSGFKRNLTAGEIVDQILSVQESAQKTGLPVKNKVYRVSHVVFMGMGEPLINYDATVRAVHIMNGELGIAMRHLTVSTAGYIPGIRKLASEDLQITLAVSLHAPTDELRQKLIPTFHEYAIKEIIQACREYVRLTGRRITIEYCLLRGVNDSASMAQKLTTLLRGLNCHVNLIPYNAVERSSFHAPQRESIQAFREILEAAGINVTQRQQRGAAIAAACGQLRERVLAERTNSQG